MNENQKNKKITKKNIVQFVLLGLFLIICIALTIYLYPIIMRIQKDEEFKQAFISKIDSFGGWGVLIILMCFILQNVLAVIPTAPFELVSGMMYGTFNGVLLCLLGSTLGALVVIWLVKFFGEDFAKKFVNMEDKKRFKFVDDPKRTGVIMFSILFMPGIPKDFLCFLVPFTKVKTWQFLILNLVARTPSVIITALLGDSLITGEITLSVVLFVIALIISILGVIFNKRIVEFINKIGKTKKEE